MYRPWSSLCLLLPMVSSLYCLYECSVIVAFICIENFFNNFGVASNVRRSFSVDVNAETISNLSYSSCPMFCCFGLC